jgi:hypothetical protein
MAKEKGYDFENYSQDALTRPRDLAWSNWFKFENTGDKVQGYIKDAFYRPAEGMFKDQRGITLEQPDGTLVNVGIKRHEFVLSKTDWLRIGDPLTIVLEEEKPSATKGFSPTKIFGFYGKNLPENAGNPTVKELDNSDQVAGGTTDPEPDAEVKTDPTDGDPFEGM